LSRRNENIKNQNLLLYLTKIDKSQLNIKLMLGSKLKELRETKGLVQREIAALLQVDTAFISKAEKEEKQVSEKHIECIAKFYEIDESELKSIWLADKILKILNNEMNATQVLKIVEYNIKRRK
jgi:transcriptional regulator with XRE-family HTH domain